MIKEIKMPAAGQTTDAAQIMKILVKPGDHVKRGDALFEAETDKATLPVESYVSGVVLEVLVSEGDDVGEGTVLARIGSEEDWAAWKSGTAAAPVRTQASDVQAVPKEEEQDDYRPVLKGARTPAPAPASKPVSAAQTEKTPWPAMPNAKMLAREMGVSLEDITPANGVMITRKDVLAAAEPNATAHGEQEQSEYEILPMSRTREVIARRMLQSTQTIPAWQCTVTIDMEACMALKDAYGEKMGVKISYNDILAKAIAVAAEKFPLVNARMENGEIRIYRHTNVGLAVGLEDALLVPVIREADTLSLTQLAERSAQLVAMARDGRLAPSDMGCGSVTISNLGMFDVDHFTAIVNPPESCILAVGRIMMQPVWTSDGFQPRPMMSVTGSFDHRMIDGMYGARFLRQIKTLMETPGLMLG